MTAKNAPIFNKENFLKIKKHPAKPIMFEIKNKDSKNISLLKSEEYTLYLTVIYSLQME